jgi:hypothetical protein
VTLVITTCTNRKRKPVPASLHMSTLPQSDMTALAADWGGRLAIAPTRFPAGDIYGGRAFREAAFAAEHLNAPLLVVSAGLGLIFASASVPPYACTVLIDAPDSIGSRVVGDFSIADWWKLISKASPFGVRLVDVASRQDGLICAALSDAYIEMVAADLVELSEEVRDRLRLFTRAPFSRIPAALRPYVMPYDDRLDGPDSPIRGTRGDFATRALRHFAETVMASDDGRSATEHAEAVAAMLAGWDAAKRFNRLRHDDATLLDLIRHHWAAEGGSSSRLLRRLRDKLGIACEQQRFAALARTVRAERA